MAVGRAAVLRATIVQNAVQWNLMLLEEREHSVI